MNNQYKSSSALKSQAKGQLLGNYSTMVGAFFVSTLCILLFELAAFFLVDQTTVIGMIIYYVVTFIISLLGGIFSSGEAYISLKLICGEPVLVSDIFNGFRQHPDKAVGIQLYITIVSFVCMIPTVILSFLSGGILSDPAIGTLVIILLLSALSIAASVAEVMISLLLSQAYYLLQDFPDYTAKDIVLRSIRLIKGHKGRLFYITLSFIPLYLLGFLSCCIGLLWIRPYTQVTLANFYMDLMQQKN